MSKNDDKKLSKTSTKLRKRKAGSKRRTRMVALEPRMLFDGALVADIAAEAAQVAQAQAPQAEAQADASPAAEIADALPAAGEAPAKPGAPTPAEASQPGAAAEKSALEKIQDSEGVSDGEGTGEVRREIVFVDPTVRDFQTLVDGINNPNIRVVMLDPHQDGLGQIAQALQQSGQVDAVHIISHGTEGHLNVGSTVLSNETMQTYAEQLATIKEHLSENADLLIYGCDFGKGEAGKQAADTLAQMTGADVAASSDATGHASLGGDWDLEVRSGSIETDIAVDLAAQEAWHDVLALHTLDFDTAPAWTGGSTSMVYTVDGFPITISYNGNLDADPVLNNNYNGGATPAQDALQFVLGSTGSNTFTIDFSGQPGGSVSNVGFALYDVDNNEYAVFTGNKAGVGAIPPTQVATSANNSVGTITATSIRVNGNGSDATAGSPNGNTYVYFNTSDITSVSFTYTGTANVTLVVLNDITFMGKNSNPPVVDLDASTSGAFTAADDFSSQGYAGSTGTIPWTGAWAETDTGGAGAGAGQVRVVDTPTTGTDYGMRLNNSGTAGQFTGAARTIDLSGYHTPTVTFDYMTSAGLSTADAVVLEVSSNGGTNWTLLKTYTGSSASSTAYTAESVSLAGYESTNTMIRFRISGTAAYTGGAEYFYVDNVQMTGQPTSAAVAYTEGDATGVQVAAAGNGAIADVDSTNLSMLRVAIGSPVAGDELTYTSAGGISGSYDSATGYLTLTGAATWQDYQSVLNTVRYSSTSDDPTSGGTRVTRSISVVAWDESGNESNSALSTVTITPTDDPISNVVPGAQTVVQGSTLAFSSLVGNAISVSEPDSTITVTLSVTTGTLSLSGTSGLTFTTNDGTADATMTFSGTQASVNAALNNLVYNAPAGTGTATLTLASSSASGSDSDTVSIAITSTPPRIDLDDSSASQTVGDDFSAGTTYADTSTGAIPWNGNWIESDAGGAAQSTTAGDARITDTPGAGTDYGIRLTDSSGTGGTAASRAAIQRAVDLSGHINASMTWEFDSSGNLDNADTYVVEVSTNGGASYTTVGTYNNDINASRTVSLSGYESANTVVRFRLTANFDNDEFLYIDNVVITAEPAGFAATFNESTGTPVAIVDTDSLITDVDANMASARVSIGNFVTGDTLTWTNSGGIMGSYDSATGILTLTGSSSKANYETVLESIRFSNPTDDPTAGGTSTQRSIGVTVYDPTGAASNTAVSLVTVVPQNDAPTFSSGTAGSVTEGAAAGTTVYTAAATDPDSPSVTYSLSGTDAAAFTIDANTGTVTINAIPNFEAKSSYSFNVVASDGSLNTSQAVTVSVADVAPSFSSGTTGSINEGAAANTTVYTAAASDIAGGTVTYSLVAGGDASAFTIDANTGAVTINAIPNFETKSSYSFTVRASDGTMTTDRAVTISVTDVAPTFSSGTTASVAEGAAANTTVYTAAASDIAGGTVTYSLVAGGDAGSFTIDANTGAVTINAIPNFETKSSYSFSVRASDGTMTTDRAVTISVTDVAPTFSSGTTASVAEGAAANTTVYTAAASDIAGGTVTYSLVAGGDASAFTIDANTGAVTINAIPNFETKSSYSFSVRASDGTMTTDRAVTISVTDVAPTFSSGTTASVAEGAAANTTVYTAAASDIAGGTVTYSLVAGGDASAFTIDANTGAVTINAIPNFETKSSYSFTVRASDGTMTTDRAVTISVNDVAPTFSSGTTASVAEGAAANTTVYTAAASDIAGGTVTYSLVAGGDAGSFTIDANTGAVTINAIPNFETKSSYSFTVRASDGTMTTDRAVTISVTDVAPTFSSGTTASVAEGAAANTTVYTAAASDIAGGTVTYSLVAGGDAGSFTIDANTGAVTINAIPNFETKSSYSFSVRASDGTMTTDRAVTISVTDVAPTFSSGTTASVAEGAAANTTVYTAAASDIAGGTVTYSLVAGGDASAFTIDANTGAVTINAIPNFETKSSYSFSVRASDGTMTTDRAVTISVTDVAPGFSSGSTGSVAEGAAANSTVYTAAASDIAGGTVTYSLVAGGDASSFTIDANTGAVTINAIPNFETKSSYSFSVRASDGTMTTDQAVTISVTDVAPTFSSGTTASVAEGAAANTTVYTAAASDIAGGAVTYSLVAGGDAGSFTIDANTGAVTINAIPNFETKSSYSFSVRASDGTMTTDQAVTISVTDVAPTFSSGTTASVAEGAAANTTVYTAAASDIAGGTVTYSLVAGGDASAFTIDANTGAVTINGTPNFETQSSYSFTVRASDGTMTTDRAVTISVNDQAPTFSSGTTASIAEGSAANSLVYTAAASDIAGGTITYSLGGTDAAAFSIDSSTGAVRINAIPDFEAKSAYSIDVIASDGTLSATRAVTISVNDVAPTFSSGTTASVAEGAAANTTVYTAAASDIAGGTVTYSIVAGGDAGSFTIDANTGAVTINATPDFETKSSYSITVRASDGTMTTDQAVTLSVNDQAPTFSSGTTASVAEGAAANTTVYTAAASDIAGGAVTYSLVAGGDASAFTIDANTGAVTINGTPNFETQSSYSFTVRASDGTMTADRAVTISVTDLAPTFSSGTTASVSEGAAANTVVYTAAASDIAGGTVTYSVSGADASAFTIDANTGALRINAIPNFEAQSSYSVTVTASDGTMSTNQAVTISVNDQAPTFSSGTAASVAEGAAANTIVHTAAASDVAGGTVTYSLSGADASAFTIDTNTGAVRINAIPDYEAKASYSINVVASDGTLSTTQAVTVSVTDVAPTISSGAAGGVTEGASAGTVVYTAAASDVAGGAVTYSLAGTDAGAFTIDANTGVVTINAVPNFEAKSSYSIDVVASDGILSSTQAVVVSVADAAPTISSGAAGGVNEGAAAGTTVYTAAATDPAGGTVTYSLSGADAGAFTIDSNTGVVTINAIPNFETKSSYAINVVASDGTLTSAQAVTVSVADVAPAISSGATGSVAEGAAAGATVYTAAASDVAGGAVTYSLSGADAGAFTIDANTGVVTINSTPDFEAKNSYSINVVASDGTLSSSQAVTVSVTDVAPGFSSGAAGGVTEGAAAGTTVYTAAASDIAGGTVSYSLSGADAGAFTIDANTGVVTINAVPNFEAKSNYSINVVASDGTLASTQAVTISVADVAPGFSSGTTGSVNEGATAGTAVYTAAASDIAGGSVTYSLSGADAAAFTIDSNTGVVTINGTPDFEAQSSYTINVVASDGTLSSTQAITVSVNDLAPSFSSGAVGGVTEGASAGTAVYTAAASDVAGGTVTYSLAGADAAAFSIDANTGVVTINGVPNFEAKSSYSISVVASDGTLSSSQAVTVNVADVSPTFSSGAAGSVAEGSAAGSAVYSAAASDVAGGTVTYSLSGGDASAFTIDANTGAVTINAMPDFETQSSYSFNVIASDGTLSTTHAVSISVTDVAPAISSGAAGGVTEGAAAGTAVYTAVASDVAGGAVTYSLAGADAGAFTIDANTGVVTINGTPNFEAKSSYSIDVVASDGNLASSRAVTIAVADVAPSFSSGTSGSVAEGASVGTAVYAAAASDVAGGTVTYALSGADAAAFTIDANTGVVTINATPDFETKSSYSISVVASDGTLTSSQAVTVSVSDVAPGFSSGATGSVNEGATAGTAVYTAAASDVAGGAVTYSLNGADAAAFTIDSNTGVVTINGMPNFEAKPSYSINVVASDGTMSTSQAVTVSVNDVAPSFSSGAAGGVAEGAAAGTTVYTAAASDVAGGTVTYTLSGADAAAFTIDANTGVVTINATPDFETKASYSISVVASDGTLTSSQAVTVSVSDVAPGFSSGNTGSIAEASAAGSTVYTAAASDVAGGTVTYSLSGADAGAFTIDANSGVVTINAMPDFETKNSYSFNVVASDGTQSTSQAVTVSVTDVSPTFSSGTTGSVTEGVAAGATVYTAAASDPAGGTVTYSLSGADAAAFTIDSNTGVVTINGSPDFETKSSYSINVVASDGTLTSTRAVTVGVINVVEGSSATLSSSSGASVTEGGSVVYTASVSEPVSGSDLVLTLSNGQTVTIPVGASTGSVTYTVRADDIYVQANDSLSVTIVGSAGGDYETLDLLGTVATTVTDDADTTTVTLSSASGATVAEGGSVVYTASVGAPVTGADLTVTLSNGQTITIPVGSSSASVTYAVRADNPYVQGDDSLSVSISGTAGGAYEAVSLAGTVNTTVTDDADTTTVTLSSASGATVAEGGSVVYTASVGAPVTGADLTVTLSNGQTITIPVGSSSASVTYAVRADNPYVQGDDSLSVSISGTAGGAYEAVSLAGTVNTTVTDDADTTTVTLSSASGATVAEGGSVVYTASVGAPVTGADLTVTLSNGQTITIPVGSSSASVTYAVRADNPYVQGDDSLSVSISGTAGGAYEAVSLAGTVNTTVTDDADTTTVTLSSASGATVAEGGSVVYTASVGAPVTGADLTVTLSNGQTITIPVGSSSASVTYAVRADNPYVQGDDSLSVSISGTAGGAYEAVSLAGTVNTTVTDDADTTTVTLSSASGATVAEGGSVVYTASVGAPVTGADLTVTLSNGQTITIPVGSSSASVTYAVRADNPYVQGDDSLSVSISGTAGGAYEAVSLAGTVNTTVTDDADTTTVTLSSASGATVAEGGSVVYTASVGAPVTGADLTVTLSNGQTITIPVGSSSASVTYAVRADNPYVQGDDSLSVSISGTAGGAYEAVSLAGTVNTTVTDDADTTTVTLSSASGATVAEGGSVVYTASVGAPVTGADLTVTLSNGQTITIPVGSSSASVTYAVRADNPYVQGDDSLSVSISGTAGGAYEAVSLAGTVNTTVTDDADTTTVTLSSASGATVAEGGSVVYTASVGAPVTGADLTVTLSNGQTITIPVGSSSASVTYAVRADNPYVQGDDSLSVSISGTAGGAYEAVSLAGTVNTTVTDDADTTTVTLSSASGATVAEGGSVVYTASVGAPVTGADLTVTLSNGQTITIPVGSSSASVTYAVRADNPYVQGDDSLSVSISGTAGGAYEAVSLAGTVNTTVTDDADTTTVTLSSASGATVAEGGSVVYTASVGAPVTGADLTVTLSNGQTITIPVGSSSASVTYAVRADNPYVQGDDSLSVSISGTAGGAYEAVSLAGTVNTTVTDDADTTTVTLSSASGATVAEGGSVVYTASVGAPVTGADLTVTLSNGQTITIPVGSSSASVTYAVRADNPYVQGDDSLSVSISGTAGGAYEAVSLAGTVNTTVTDDADTTTVTLSSASGATVAEGGSVVYTASVGAPVTGADLTVTLSNGQTITIPVGSSSASVTYAVRADNPYVQGDDSLSVSISGTAGGAYEAVSLAGTVNTTVTDDADTTTVTLSSASGATVAEGGSVVYTASVGAPVTGADLTVTLSNGQTITIPVGSSSASVTYAVRADNPYVQGDDSLSVSISGTAGGAYEAVSLAGTVNTTVTDDADTTTVTLSSASGATVAEGGSVVYTASVGAPVTGADLTVTLSNGQTITIPVGSSSASVTYAVRADNPYVQGDDSLSVSISGTAGGAYEAVSLAGTVNTTVTDDADTTTVTLSSASGATVAEGGSVVYTASVGAPVTGADLTVTLSNGQTITIPVGSSSASVTYAVRADNPYVQGDDSLSVSISGTAGGAYEAVSLAGTVNTTVTDDADTTTVTLSSASGATVAEGGSVVYTASVGAPVTGADLTVTLSNGQTITIPVGSSSASVTYAVRADNPYVQGDDSLSVSISGTAGGAYEAVSLAGTVNTTVTDDADTTTVTLSSASGATVAEGGSVVYTASVGAPVTGADLTVTLSNGQTITIPVGSSSASVTYAVRADNPYVQGDDSLSVSISGTAGGAYEAVSLAGTVNTTVTDDADTTTVTLSSASGATVAEGGSVVYTASVGAPVTGADLTVTLSNGQTITIPVGSSSASVTYAVRADNPYVQGDDSLSVSISGTAGGAYEAVSLAGTVNTTVTDDADTTTVTLSSASGATVAEGGSVVYTASVGAPVTGADLTVTLSNGQTITIPVGSSSASVTYAVRADNPYVQGDDSLSVSISGTAGGAYEAVSLAGTVNTTVTDDADTTTVTLSSASGATVAEGGSVVYTASVGAPVTGADLTVTLSNGQTITIPVGSSSASVTYAVRADNPYVQGDDSLSVSISGTAGGAYEAVSLAGTVNTTVTDDADTTTVTLSSASGATVAEGGSVVYTASVGAPVTGADLTVTLSNGQTITIPVGSSSASVTYAVRADNPYVQGDDSLSVSISGTAGGAYEAVSLAGTVNTTVTDDADTTTVTLSSASGATVAEGGSVVYTASVGAPVTGADLTVTLSNGQTITIPVGSSSASVTYAVRADNPYVQGDDSLSVSISGTAGGAYEAVSLAGTVNTTVTDDADTTTVTLSSASGATVAEGGSVVYTASVGAPVTGADLTVTLSNGQTITIPVGSSSASVTYAVRADNPYVQGDDSLSVSISGTAGGAYEAVSLAGTVNTTVTDDADTTTVTLSSASGATVAEGGSVVYTASVGAPVTGADLTVTLSNGQTITIPVGSSSASVTYAVRADNPYVQGDDSLSVSISGTAGGAYEAVSLAGTVNTTVTDDADTTTVTLSSASGATVAEGGSVVYTASVGAPVTGADLTVTLSNGQTITIPVGSSSASVTYAVRADNPYVQGDDSLSVSISGTAGGAYEAVSLAGTVNTTVTDDADTTTVTLSSASGATVAEGGSVVYTASVGAPVTGADLTVTLSNGQTITIPVGSSSASVTYAVRADNPYVQGDDSLSVSISGTAGGAYEAVSLAGTVNTTVTDDADTTTVTLSSASGATVAEGGSVVYTASVGAPVTGADLTVTLSNGQTITIPVGSSSASVTYAVRADNPYVQGDDSLSVSISGTAGGAYEAVSLAGTVNTTVTDDADTTTVTLSSASGATVAEGGSVVYTASVGAPVTGADLTVTLSNGQTITIPVGSSSASVTYAVRADNPYVQGDDSLSVSISGTAGGAYEAVSLAGTVNTTVTDDADTTTVTLSSASGATVAEGGSVVYTASVGAPVTGADLTVTLSNGQTITIPVGSSSASVTYAVRADNPYVQGDDSLSVSISGTAGGAYEAVSLAGTVNTTVTDDADTTTVTLSSASGATVAEGGSVVYTASVGAPVTGADLTVTLSNGQTITIPVGSSSASVTYAVRADNPYVQGDDSLSVSISGTAGGAYEAVSLAGTVNTTVTDDADTTTVTLSSASGATVAEGGSVVYTASVGAPVTGADLTVTLSNGQTITIPVGSSSASVTYAVRADNPYVQGDDSLSVSISGTAGGAYEAVSLAGTVNTTVTDDADTTTVTLSSASGATVAEGGSVVYTASVGAPVTGADLTVTLSNGQTITIPVGSSSASVTYAVRADNPYVQGDDSLSVSISGTAGGAYEAVSLAGTVNTTVTDDADTTTVTLIGTGTVAEGGIITYTASVTSPVTGSDVIVTLSNGQTITIAVGQSTGTVTFVTPGGSGGSTISTSVAGVAGGGYEILGASALAATTTVTDGPLIVTPIPDQSITAGASFSYALPAGTFADADTPVLALSATLSDGSPLPGWLSFDPGTGTFSGMPPVGFPPIDVRVVASDGTLSANDVFRISATPTVVVPSVPVAPVTPPVVTDPTQPVASGPTPPAGSGSTPGSGPAAPIGSIGGGQPAGPGTAPPPQWNIDPTIPAADVSGGMGGPAPAPTSTPSPVAAASIGDVLNSLPATAAVSPDMQQVSSAGEVSKPAAVDIPGLADKLVGFPALETARVQPDGRGFPAIRLQEGDPAGTSQTSFAGTGHRLFVYQGIATGGFDASNLFQVPADAFAHTDPTAIILLEARLASGAPLPSWLSFDGVSGQFSGVPPEGLSGAMDLEVTAKDNEGREARVIFRLLVADLRVTEREQQVDPQAPQLGLDVDKHVKEKKGVEKTIPAPVPAKVIPGKAGAQDRDKVHGAAPFTEQLVGAKAPVDPLLGRIIGQGGGEAPPKP